MIDIVVLQSWIFVIFSVNTIKLSIIIYNDEGKGEINKIPRIIIYLVDISNNIL